MSRRRPSKPSLQSIHRQRPPPSLITPLIAELAPDEVSADTKVLRDGFVNFRDQLAEVDYDVASADLAALADAELHAASDAIISYSATVCDPASD